MNANPVDDRSITVGRSMWARYAEAATERWLAQTGGLTQEMRLFGNYLREQRYRTGLDLSDIAHDLGMPYEELVLMEQGFLKPSEIPGKSWVRLVRLLDGREQLARGLSPSSVSPSSHGVGSPLSTEDVHTTEFQGQPDRNAAPIGVARIKIIGVGGGGSNAVSRMHRQRIVGVEYVAVNTDAQHLLRTDVPEKIRIGDLLTRGLGVGGDPNVGREAAQESREEIYETLKGTEMVFLAAGMGGGTGTGAIPVIAEIAREVGALTIAVVTKPFAFEGRRRRDQADEGVAILKDHVDTLILIPNDRLSSLSDEAMTAENAFRIADDVLRQGVQSIAELVTMPGDINLDFADVKTVMKDAGPAWMAIGTARGEGRALTAARSAIASPLLDVPIEGSTRVLLNISGGPDLTLQEVHQAADFISSMVDPDANIIFGMVTDPTMEDEVRVTIIATGLPAGADTTRESLEEMLAQSLGTHIEAEDAPAPAPPSLLLDRLKFLGRQFKGDDS
jgi:cell division protein FtsZ